MSSLTSGAILGANSNGKRSTLWERPRSLLTKGLAMRRNLSCRRASACSVFILLAVSILSGYASNDRDFLGRMQVGDAGAVCSFFTTLFDGPDVGRGRNEGH